MPRRVLLILLLGILTTGCGGGGGSSSPPPPPPPPSPDFTLSLGGSQSFQQGGPGTALSISVTPSNGFSGSVSISLEGLPTGVSASPATGLSVSPGQQLMVAISASSAAAAGNFTLTVRGISGSLNHTAALTMTITAAAPFQISVNPTSVSLAPGTTTTAQLTMTAPQGSNPSAVIEISKAVGPIGAGVFVTATQPFISPGQSVTLSVQADLNVESKTVPFQITAMVVPDVSAASLQVTVNNSFPATAPPSRTTFVRTDEEVNDAVYDPAHKLVFATVHDLNKVEVFTSLGQRLATIPVPRPFGIDQAPDGKILVGTRSGALYEIDPDALEAVNRVIVPQLIQPFNTFGISLWPEIVKAASNGIALVVAREGNTTARRLLKWDLASGSVTDTGAAQFQFLVRSQDFSTVVLAWFDSSGANVAIYDPATDSISPTTVIDGAGGTIHGIAVNSDGSRIKIGVNLYDHQLQVVPSGYLPLQVGTSVFSRDGARLLAIVGLSSTTAIGVFDSQNFASKGLVSSVDIDFGGAEPVDVDETDMVFGVTGRGLAFVDAGIPHALSSAVVAARRPNAFDPPSGSPSSPGATSLFGVNLATGAQVIFGESAASPQSHAATNISVVSSNELRLTPPPATVGGPSHVILTEPGGWNILIPEAYSYGPHVLFMDMSAGPASGGSVVQIFGYGFKFSANQITVTLGGRAATVTSVAPGPPVTPYSFPLHIIQIKTPTGSPGLVDLTITTPDGSTTVPRAFQYLAQAQIFQLPGAIGEVIYDRGRSRLFAANFAKNQVEVLALPGPQLLAPIPAGSQASNLALSPDRARLFVGNFGSNTVTVLDPDIPASATSIPVPSLGCTERLFRIVGVKPRRALVTVLCGGGGGGRTFLLDAATQSFGCGVSAGCDALVTSIGDNGFGLASAASSDGRWVFASQPSLTDSLIGLWDVDSDSAQFSSVSGSLGDAAVDADGRTLAGSFGIFDSTLNPTTVMQELKFLRVAAQSLNNLLGEALHPSGSLLYVPTTTSVDVFDVHRGRLVLRVATPEPIPPSTDALAVDEHGRRIFLASNSGVTILELAVVPLGIGNLSVSQGSAAGGTSVTIRGSGFQSGATVSFGGSSVSATFVDEGTLTVTTPAHAAGAASVTVLNPDGSQYTLPAAFKFL